MSVLCHRRRIEIFRHLFSIRQRPNVFFLRCLAGARQMPGRRPPHITGLHVSTVTLGWVGAPNERSPFRFHDAIADFPDRCLTRTRIADRRPGFGGGFVNIARASPAPFSSPRELSQRVQNLPMLSRTASRKTCATEY